MWFVSKSEHEKVLLALETERGANKILAKELSDLEDPENWIKAITDLDFKWYDYEDLPPSEWISYHREAQMLLGNSVFQNEVKHVLSELLSLGITDNKVNDPQVLRDCRMMILTLSKFKAHLDTIKPYVESMRSTTENLHNSI